MTSLQNPAAEGTRMTQTSEEDAYLLVTKLITWLPTTNVAHIAPEPKNGSVQSMPPISILDPCNDEDDPARDLACCQ